MPSPNEGSKSMQITDILAQMGGLKSMAKDLGISEGEARTGASALIPAILGGLKKQAQEHPQGVEGLGGLLNQLGGGGLLDNLLSPKPTDVSQGNDVLGEIFGSKSVSRDVAQEAAQTTGLAPDLLKKLLPLVAMAVAGYMAKQPSSGGGLASMLDADGDGNVMDDVMRMAGKFLR
jgi:hypothetical protein